VRKLDKTFPFEPLVAMFHFLNGLTSLRAQQMNGKDRRMDTKHGICVISQLCPSVSSSFEHSFSSMKAYTNLHEAILAISSITL